MIKEEDLPEGWKLLSIGDIGTVDSGQGAPQGEEYYKGEELFVKAGDLNRLSNGHYVGDFCKKITSLAIDEYNLKKYSKRSLVFPKSGMSVKTDNVAVLKYDSYVVNHLAIIQVNEEIDSEFLYYLLKKFKTSNLSKNPSYPSIRISDIKSFIIPWPPRNQRNKIVSILEKTEKAKQLRKEADELTKDYLNSVFLEMFGDPVGNPLDGGKVKIGTFIEDIISGWSVGGENRPKNDGEMGVLKISAVTYGRFNPREYKVVKKDRLNKKLVHPLKGDVLFSRANTRELVAAVCIVDENYPDLFLPDKLWKIVLNQNIVNPYYFATVLGNERYRYELTKNATGTSGSMLNVSMKKLKNTYFPVPPIELQNKFAEIVQQVERLRESQSQSRQQIDDLFDSSMQRAFKGELAC